MTKIGKTEPFNLERLVNDLADGKIRGYSAVPDFGAAHDPHVDLTVRRFDAETIKYRIYDTTGASNLLNDYGPGGISAPDTKIGS